MPTISKALKYAVEKGYIEHSVMDRVKRPRPERFVGKFLRQSEAVELFESVKGHRLELGVIMAAFYGLRRGEVVGLRWDAIDFDANAISIEHTVTVPPSTASMLKWKTTPRNQKPVSARCLWCHSSKKNC